MLAHQTPGFRTQLENGQRRRIVHIKRGIIQLGDFIIQLRPFVRRQLSAFQFLARNLAHVDNHTVDQLHVAHFQREHGYRNLHVHRHLLGHGEHESRLSHGRTGCNDDQIGVLPTGSHLVQLFEAAAQPAQSVAARRRLLQHVVSLANHGIDLRIVFLHVLLRNLEELSLGLLHQVVHIHRRVESFRLHQTGESNQLTCQEFLRDDTGMVFDMGGRSHFAAQLRDIERAAHFLQFAHGIQVFRHRQDIHRLLLEVQRTDGLIDKLVAMIVKTLGTQYLAHLRIGILLYHQCAQHSLFKFKSLRLYMSVGILLRHVHFSARGSAPPCLSRFCHIKSDFTCKDNPFPPKKASGPHSFMNILSTVAKHCLPLHT